MFELSNAKTYSESWAKESDQLKENNIYQKLAEIAPSGNVLEFGCGVGNGTIYLAKDRAVLSLDNNKNLIAQAVARLKKNGIEPRVHECDFFSLGETEKQIINDFEPKVIIGWFIGSSGEDIFRHTKEVLDPKEKSKLYREKIEDIIISPDVCVDSVQYIHLAVRSEMVAGFSEEEIFDSQKENYDTYVFKEIGFEVVKVNIFEWVRENSEFPYSQADNPILAQGQRTPVVTSVIAKRIH